MMDTITAKIVKISDFYAGERVLLDFMRSFEATDAIFVGNTMYGLFLIPSENRHSEDYLPRRFRFNVGALNQYIRTESGVIYADEITAGSAVIVRTTKDESLPVARIKREIRDFVRIEACSGDQLYSVILQKGKTSALITPEGIRYLDDLKIGDEVIILPFAKATHLGCALDEFYDFLFFGNGKFRVGGKKGCG